MPSVTSNTIPTELYLQGHSQLQQLSNFDNNSYPELVIVKHFTKFDYHNIVPITKYS